MSRGGRVGLLCLFALSVYLFAEAFQPVPSRPSARAALALIETYQSVGSARVGAAGFQCRYRPTCSHYAHDAVSHFGMIDGAARAAGRLWRCSPWGGSGYDPAVASSNIAH